MYTLYNLDEGTKVEVPLLDGVMERALKLMDEWRAKKPELDAAPSYLLFFNALTCSDLVRTIDSFQKAGLNEDLTLRFAHSRLPEALMYAGVTALLGINTWWLDNKINMLTDPPNAFGLTRDDAVGKERFKKREPWEDLQTSAEFKVELTQLVGPEATELLFQACKAYDKWARGLEHKSPPEAIQGKKLGEETTSIKKIEFKSEQILKPEPELHPVQTPTPEVVPPVKPVPEILPVPTPAPEVVPLAKPVPEILPVPTPAPEVVPHAIQIPKMKQENESKHNKEQPLTPEIEKEPGQQLQLNAAQMEKIAPPLETGQKPDLPEQIGKEPESLTHKNLNPEPVVKQEKNTKTETSKETSG